MSRPPCSATVSSRTTRCSPGRWPTSNPGSRRTAASTSSGLANYTTSVALVAFAEANTGGKYDTIINNATQFLRGLQAGNDGSLQPGELRFGGLGYDGKSRPDMSNTQYFLDALQAAGVPKDDPAVQRALKFVSRCQNLPAESNDQPFAKKTTDDDKGGLDLQPARRRQEQRATVRRKAACARSGR